jgi:DNA-binding MarR family transcriptional regulator
MRFVELLFFAYRDFTGDPDSILSELGFGRAHHRVLHFVSRNPGLRVADLLDILKITKQSLARVLRQLIEGQFIEQRMGAEDRRERRLYTTPAGTALAHKLSAPQLGRIASAMATAGPSAASMTDAFLYAMINEGDREAVSKLIAASGSTMRGDGAGEES